MVEFIVCILGHFFYYFYLMLAHGQKIDMYQLAAT